MPDPKKPMGQSSLLSFFTKKTDSAPQSKPVPQSKPAPSPQNDSMQVDSTIAEDSNNTQVNDITITDTINSHILET